MSTIDLDMFRFLLQNNAGRQCIFIPLWDRVSSALSVAVALTFNACFFPLLHHTRARSVSYPNRFLSWCQYRPSRRPTYSPCFGCRGPLESMLGEVESCGKKNALASYRCLPFSARITHAITLCPGALPSSPIIEILLWRRVPSTNRFKRLQHICGLVARRTINHVPSDNSRRDCQALRLRADPYTTSIGPLPACVASPFPRLGQSDTFFPSRGSACYTYRSLGGP